MSEYPTFNSLTVHSDEDLNVFVEDFQSNTQIIRMTPGQAYCLVSQLLEHTFTRPHKWGDRRRRRISFPEI